MESYELRSFPIVMALQIVYIELLYMLGINGWYKDGFIISLLHLQTG